MSRYEHHHRTAILKHEIHSHLPSLLLLMLPALPTKLNSGVLPGLFRKWYILDMLPLPVRNDSSSSITWRIPPCCCLGGSCSDAVRLLKLLKKFFDGSR